MRGASLWISLAASALGACSFDGRPLSGAVCVEGQTYACPCDAGDDGVQTCQPSGMLGECVCDGEGSALGPAAGRPDAAGARESGNSAGTEDGADEGSTAMGGSGGATGGTGGTGSVDAGTGPQAGAGSSGTGGAMDGGTGPDDSTPPPGAFTQCNTFTGCAGGLECAGAGFQPGSGYCTVRCRDAQGTVIAGCPTPQTGTVHLECNAASGLCQLADCTNATCPDGMNCSSVWGGFAGMVCQF